MGMFAYKMTNFVWNYGQSVLAVCIVESAVNPWSHIVFFLFFDCNIECKKKIDGRIKTKFENNTCIGLCNVADISLLFDTIVVIALNALFWMVISFAIFPSGHFHYEDPKCHNIYLTWKKIRWFCSIALLCSCLPVWLLFFCSVN